MIGFIYTCWETNECVYKNGVWSDFRRKLTLILEEIDIWRTSSLYTKLVFSDIVSLACLIIRLQMTRHSII